MPTSSSVFPSQYMLGLVPSEFKNRDAAKQASLRFTDLSVWEITTPAFDAKSKPEDIKAQGKLLDDMIRKTKANVPKYLMTLVQKMQAT